MANVVERLNNAEEKVKNLESVLEKKKDEIENVESENCILETENANFKDEIEMLKRQANEQDVDRGVESTGPRSADDALSDLADKMDTLIGNFDTLNEKVKRIERSNTETKSYAQKVKENTKEKKSPSD